MSTRLDRIPVEVLHLIFQYLSNGDVIWSFYNLSPYVNAVLHSYCLHTLNFQSASKSHFDFICNHLELRRIVSLTLSNDANTPNQVQLFFSRFHLRDLVNLHSLTLLSVTNEDIHPILSDLPKLKLLTSLFITSRLSQPLLLGQTLSQLKVLQTLSVSQGDLFDHSVTFPLHSLKVLNAGTCNFLELRRLKRIVPSLVSLKIILQANHQLQLLDELSAWSQLERLDLTLNDGTVTTFAEMNQVLSNFNNLTHLTLNLRGSADRLIDGAHWETCPVIVSLCRLNFSFEFEHPLNDSSQEIDRVYRSFSSSFWREVKKWYVVVTTQKAYTTTCFDEQLFISSIVTPLSTSPDDRWFYARAKRLKLHCSLSTNALDRFYNLEELELADESLLVTIPKIEQFTHLRHLILHQLISHTTLGKILSHHSYINHLTLTQLDDHQSVVFHTVETLHLNEPVEIANRTQVRILSRTFPSVKHFVARLHSISLVCPVVDSFTRLQNGIFHVQKLAKIVSNEWLQENTRLGRGNESFTCRNEPNRFILWIADSAVPTAHLKARVPHTISSIREQRSEKCAVQ